MSSWPGPALRKLFQRPDEPTAVGDTKVSRTIRHLSTPVTAIAAVLVLGMLLSVLSRISFFTSPLFPSTDYGYESSKVVTTGLGWLRRAHPHTPKCGSKSFTKKTLVLLAEYRGARLVQGLPLASNLSMLELSDVVGVPNPDATDPLDRYPFYVVLDNAFSILKVAGRVDDSPGTPNDLLPWPSDRGVRSEFEAIAYSPRSKTFALVQEDVVGKKTGRLHAHVYEININATSNEVVSPLSAYPASFRARSSSQP
jgi:hypothetical protein